MTTGQPCELCETAGGALLWRDDFLRVVAVEDEDYAGFCRVILNRHVKEMSDLSAQERHRMMDAVFAVEEALRELMQPVKINLASLGNLTPHLHWHVIPRFSDDRHFPAPIWTTPQRANSPQRKSDLSNLSTCLARHVVKAATGNLHG